MRQTVMRMGSLAGFNTKPTAPATSGGESSKPGETGAGQEPTSEKPMRQGMARMGSLATWGFGGKGTEPETANTRTHDDDRHIRFTIGGAGRRLTKDDFLREIQSLDPKSRAEIVRGSDAPPEMKIMAEKDAKDGVDGSNRLIGASAAQVASGLGAGKAVGAEMARLRGAEVGSDDEGSPRVKNRKLSRVDSEPDEMGESAAERKRREKAMRGIDDVTDVQRGRGSSSKNQITPSVGGSAGGPSSSSPAGEAASSTPSSSEPKISRNNTQEERETPAERKRREAALGVGRDDDSDDDDTPRVPPPVLQRDSQSQKARPGIRFAQSPVRGEGSGNGRGKK